MAERTILRALRKAGACPTAALQYGAEINNAIMAHVANDDDFSDIAIGRALRRLAKHLNRALATLEDLDQSVASALACACGGRLRERVLSRGTNRSLNGEAEIALDRLEDDLRIVAAVVNRAGKKRLRHGSSASARRLFAQCAMAWKDATGQWPAVDADQSALFGLISTSLSDLTPGQEDAMPASYGRAYSLAVRFASTGVFDPHIATPQDFLVGCRRAEE